MKLDKMEKLILETSYNLGQIDLCNLLLKDTWEMKDLKNVLMIWQVTLKEKNKDLEKKAKPKMDGFL